MKLLKRDVVLEDEASIGLGFATIHTAKAERTLENLNLKNFLYLVVQGEVTVVSRAGAKKIIPGEYFLSSSVISLAEHATVMAQEVEHIGIRFDLPLEVISGVLSELDANVTAVSEGGTRAENVFVCMSLF
ncbi:MULTISPECIES: hypothetical protein [Pseudomonas]|uniref:hypothetical protein n=1 Tax=Pseudomonas TaxID=286 RepID=UPI0005C4DE63|nr:MULTISPECIES: hypothetical protein [Pseudomonas]WOB57057.1 hypothetical protein NY023_17675 [Pseudomonas sp. NBB]